MIRLNPVTKLLAPTLIALCGLSAGSAMASDLQPSQVPAQVRAVLEKMYPQAANVEWDYDKDEVHYEADFKNAGGEVEIKVSPQGKLLYLKEDKAAGDIPEAVRTAVLTQHPQARILGANRILRDGQEWWDVGLKLDSGRHLNVYSSPDGKSLR